MRTEDHAEKLILKKIGDVLLTSGIEGVFQLFSILTHCEFIMKKRRFFLRNIDDYWFERLKNVMPDISVHDSHNFLGFKRIFIFRSLLEE